MATFVKRPSKVEAVQIPRISITQIDPFDWPEKPGWVSRAIERGDIRPSLTDVYDEQPEDTIWVYEIGDLNNPNYVFVGDWVVQIADDELRMADGLTFKAVYQPAEEVKPEHNVLDVRYDELTLQKVYKAFMDNNIEQQKSIDVVNAMQNEGILFRERA